MTLTQAPPVPQVLEIMVPTRISLITPPSEFLTDERVFITLGILKVAASLEEQGTIVEALDCSGIENYLEAVAKHATTSKTSIFGLTATTPQLPQTVNIIEVLRRTRPDAKIIVGGPHVTLANAAWRGEKKRGVYNGRAAAAMGQLIDLADVLVAGDGEDAIFAACHPNAPSVIDADDTASPYFLTDARLNDTRWPARHLVELDTYRYTIDGAPALSLIAQLGCPYACGFCGGRNSKMLRLIRTRTNENILAELEHLYRATGKTGFMFYDDELNVNKEMAKLMRGIAELQRSLSVEWKLRGFIKSNLFTDEQAAAMYDAGFRWMLIGFESGSERILTNINKKATKAQNTRCMEIAKRHGLKVKALMSIGHPGETPETIEETYEWLREMAHLMEAKEKKNFDFDLTIITAYLGTPYYDEAVRNIELSRERNEDIWTYTYQKTGDRLHQIALDYTRAIANYKGIPGEYTSYVFTDTLTPDDIVEARDLIENKVRAEFCIPANQGLAAKRYEHSMGQGGLPSFILRTSSKNNALPA